MGARLGERSDALFTKLLPPNLAGIVSQWTIDELKAAREFVGDQAISQEREQSIRIELAPGRGRRWR